MNLLKSVILRLVQIKQNNGDFMKKTLLAMFSILSLSACLEQSGTKIDSLKSEVLSMKIHTNAQHIQVELQISEPILEKEELNKDGKHISNETKGKSKQIFLPMSPKNNYACEHVERDIKYIKLPRSKKTFITYERVTNYKGAVENPKETQISFVYPKSCDFIRYM